MEFVIIFVWWHISGRMWCLKLKGGIGILYISEKQIIINKLRNFPFNGLNALHIECISINITIYD